MKKRTTIWIYHTYATVCETIETTASPLTAFNEIQQTRRYGLDHKGEETVTMQLEEGPDIIAFGEFPADVDLIIQALKWRGEEADRVGQPAVCGGMQ